MNKMAQVNTRAQMNKRDCKNTEGLAEPSKQVREPSKQVSMLSKKVRELSRQVRELSKKVRELTEQVSMLSKGSHSHFLFKLLQVYESRATVELLSIQKQQHRRS